MKIKVPTTETGIGRVTTRIGRNFGLMINMVINPRKIM